MRKVRFLHCLCSGVFGLKTPWHTSALSQILSQKGNDNIGGKETSRLKWLTLVVQHLSSRRMAIRFLATNVRGGALSCGNPNNHEGRGGFQS